MQLSVFAKLARKWGASGGHALEHAGMGILTPGVYNFHPKNYPITRKALASLRANGTRFNVLCLGDSTTAGGYAGGVSNAIAGSYPRFLSDMLTASGIQCGWQNFNGEHNINGTSTLPVIDTRVTLGSGWAPFTSGGYCIGGYPLINSSNTNQITFTPTIQTDTLDVFYLDGSGAYDNFTIGTGAAGATTPTTGGSVTVAKSNLIKKATATYTLGSNVWSVKKANANSDNLLIQGMVAYNSAQPEMQFLNCGAFGKKLSFLQDSTYYFNPLSALTTSGNATYGNPLAIIDFGINDWISGTDPSTYLSQLTALVTAYQNAGTEVLLVVPVPTNPASSAPPTLAAQAAIARQIYAVAAAKNCAVVDLTYRWGSYAAANPLGYYGDAITHPSKLGYADVAMAIRQFFLSL